MTSFAQPTSKKNSQNSSLRELSLEEIDYTQQLEASFVSHKEIESFLLELEVAQLPFPSVIVEEKRPGEYTLLFGLKTILAANLAQHPTASAFVVASKEHSLEEEICAQFHWDDLNEIERAKAYQWLLDEYKYSPKTLAGLLQTSRSALVNQMRLLQLPSEIQKAILEQKISKSHGLRLLKGATKEIQLHAFEELLSKKLSVRELDTLLSTPKKKEPKRHTINTSIKQDDTGAGTISFSFSSPSELNQLLEYFSAFSLHG